jgi:threonine synthase
VRFFEGYKCSGCGKELPAGSQAGECPACSSPLLCVYETGLLRKNADREDFFSCSERSVWRFRRLLPDFPVQVSLGEGSTPLIEAGRLAEMIGAADLRIKDESLNPTGSFKARGMAVAVSRLVDLDVRSAVMPSAGNAGLALAAYGAFAGIETRLFIPSSAPEGIVEECRAYGAHVEVVPGLLPDAAARMGSAARGDPLGVVSTFREPCRVEGKKTIAFEIEADSGDGGVDWILFPTGGGTGIVAVWKAYRELEELGWLRWEKPSLVAVQSTGCAPIVRAFERGDERIEPWEDPSTMACGICVPSSRADRLILDALRQSGGTAVAVTDAEILQAVGEISRCTGIFPSPEGAATWAGLKRLVSRGTINPSDRIVLVNTAGGARYRFLFDSFVG